MDSVGIRLLGAWLNLRSAHAPLMAYVREHARGLVGPPAEEPDVDVLALWTAGEWDPERSPFAADGPLERIGKRMLGSPDELIWLDTQMMPGLQIRLRRRTTRWSFDVSYHFHPRSKHAHELEDYEYKKYFNLMSYLVYYPLFWQLERARRCALVHAASLLSPGGAVLIGGLGGVGKTTLAVALSRRPGFALGSENLTLTDGEHVIPCAEPIRLDPASLALLGPVPGLSPMRFPPGLKDKHLFHTRPIPEGPPWAPLAVLLPQFSRRGITRLAPELAAERLAAMHRLTLEVDDYMHFAAALDLHWPRPGATAERTGALDRLMLRAPCYLLGVDPAAGVDAAVEDVLRAID